MINLPAQSNLKLWVDSLNITSAGGKASVLIDQSPAKNNINQATVSAQPTIVTNSLNGKQALNFASGQWMESALNPVADADNITFFLVASNGFAIGRGLDGYGSGWGIFDIVNNSIAIVSNSARWTTSYTLSGTNFVSTGLINKTGGALTSRLNGNSATSGIPNAPLRNSSKNWLLNKYTNDSTWGAGNFYEMIVYNTLLTTTQIVQIETYLAVKYGLTIAAYDYSLLSKLLIKQGGYYYTLKSGYYDSVAGTYSPLALTGGSIPNSADLDNYAFTDIALLTLPVTVNGSTFKPIDKLFTNFELKSYGHK